MKKRLLVIERDDATKKQYRDIFYKSGIELVALKDLSAGIELLKSRSPIDGLIVDYQSLLEAGLERISYIKSIKPNLVFVVTGHASTEEIVHCIRLGIDDFVEKPFSDPEAIRTTVERFLEKSERSPAHKQENLEPFAAALNRMVGQSKPVFELKRKIQKIAPLDSTVLILGETGTGKEVTARMIHALSPQRENNFIPVHCGGIPDTLLESALFGHEKGAFTGAYKTHKGYFEIANNGTIFLDEIGDTTPSFQVKLLRVLQDKKFRRIGGTELMTTNARIIAATNRDLKAMVEEDKFREDLYYRLNVITLRIPPLRERPEDIPLLIRHFVNIYSKKHNHLGVYFKPECIEILQRQPWKGNVRELENVIERLVALSDSDWIGPEDLPKEFLQTQSYHFLDNAPFLPYHQAKELFEKEYIMKLLIRTHGNVSRAAKLAGMPRQNLHLKIKKHNLRYNADAANFFTNPSVALPEESRN